MMMADDTICAISTALGGAVSIVRVSGPDAEKNCGRLWHGRTSLGEIRARELALGRLSAVDGELIDPQCLAVRMPGPHSYTGEDVVELQCHGGALCARLALEALLKVGCHLAEPGEFTKRAFLNGRMDLTQAEAVADLIGAGSEAALRLAGRHLEGRLGERIRALHGTVSDVLAEITSRLDFPEEELDWREPQDMMDGLAAVQSELAELLRTRREGEVLRGGLSLVIIGPPNAGKSSLLNHLLGRDRAIVTDIPGTTRDTIEASLTIRGIPLRLMDTAGIRDGGDVVEQAGMTRARDCAEAADLVIWLADATRPLTEQTVPSWNFRGVVLSVINKMDLAAVDCGEAIPISVKTGEGMEGLYDAVENAVWSDHHENHDEVAVAARHAGLLEEAEAAVRRAAERIVEETWELAAVDLRTAVAALGRITGQSVEPDVLGAIFSKFCIGK
ncbi:MAG: tRNA uridine-5-carboxymethylaminomethyl(34) synthesis GTPase MnmE [Victivallales bacterium]|nr:tRNA uridine-5-carboxymethylaminomethyl(34) synthesis GTPase MnmE [Victivallales bacterium]